MFSLSLTFFFFFNDTATTEIYTLSLHDALPICEAFVAGRKRVPRPAAGMMALETFREGISSEFYGPVPANVKRTRESSNRLFPFTSRGAICRISSIFCDVSTKPSMNGRRLPVCRERIGKGAALPHERREPFRPNTGRACAIRRQGHP